MEWKDVPEFEGLYQACPDGNIRSLNTTYIFMGNKATKKGRVLKPTVNVSGYLTVCLGNKGKSQVLLVHRLICKTFLPNPENKKTVNHKNGIKTDNRIENLEWNTIKENVKHSFTHLNRRCTWHNKKGANHPASRKISCPTLDIEFPSIRETAKQIGVTEKYIGLCCNNKIISVKGLVFKYI